MKLPILPCAEKLETVYCMSEPLMSNATNRQCTGESNQIKSFPNREALVFSDLQIQMMIDNCNVS